MEEGRTYYLHITKEAEIQRVSLETHPSTHPNPQYTLVSPCDWGT